MNAFRGFRPFTRRVWSQINADYCSKLQLNMHDSSPGESVSEMAGLELPEAHGLCHQDTLYYMRAYIGRFW